MEFSDMIICLFPYTFSLWGTDIISGNYPQGPPPSHAHPHADCATATYLPQGTGWKNDVILGRGAGADAGLGLKGLRSWRGKRGFANLVGVFERLVSSSFRRHPRIAPLPYQELPHRTSRSPYTRHPSSQRSLTIDLHHSQHLFTGDQEPNISNHHHQIPLFGVS